MPGFTISDPSDFTRYTTTTVDPAAHFHRQHEHNKYAEPMLWDANVYIPD